MNDYRQKRGKLAEKIAIEFLRKKKFAIIAKNYRYRGGEIDIIAYDRAEKELAFVEVRSKWFENFNRKRFQTAFLAEDTVDRIKLRKIEKTAWLFLEKETKKWQPYFKKLPIYSFPEWRIDLISVEIEKSSSKAQIRHSRYLYA